MPRRREMSFAWIIDGGVLVLLAAILVSVKGGFNEVIRGLESIDRKLSEGGKG
jgi:hypothetical protein